MPRLKVTLITLDTCGCQCYVDNRVAPGIHISRVDLEALQKARIESRDPSVNRKPLPIPYECPAHEHLGDTPALYAIILNENQRKNRAIAQAIENMPSLTHDDIGWAYDNDRLLVLNLPAGKSTVPQINALSGIFTNLFGPDKIQVNRV